MVSIHRTICHGGESILIWNKAGLPGADQYGVQTTLEWLNSAGVLTKPTVFPYSQQESGYDTWKKIMISTPTVPGVYTLVVPSDLRTSYGTITVYAAPQTQPFITVNPGDESKIQGFINSGNSVLFNPGVYTFTASLKLLTGTVLKGINANVVTLVKAMNTLDYANHLIEPQPLCQLVNLTIKTTNGAYVLWNSESTDAHNNYISNCIFDGVMALGQWQNAGLIVDRCVFNQATFQQVSSHVWIRNCDFIGGSYAFSTWGGDSIALTDVNFLRTDRGFVYEGIGTQPYTNSLNYRISMTDINYIANGCELLLLEGGTATNNLFMHFRTDNCIGAGVEVYNAAASNNLFYDFELTKSNNVWFYQFNTATQTAAQIGALQTDNVMDTFEMDGGWVGFGLAQKNTFQNSGIIRPTSRMGNQLYYDPKFYLPGTIFTAGAGTSNNISNVSVEQMPTSWKLSDGNEILTNVVSV